MTEQRAQRSLAAILAADVVDDSQLMRADEMGTRAFEPVTVPEVANSISLAPRRIYRHAR